MSDNVTFIDTSVWIEALQSGGRQEAREAVAEAVETGTAIINGLVKTELLKGARDDAEYKRLERLLEAVVCVPLTPGTVDAAARLGYDLRRAGVNVPTVDLLIAASAIVQEATLLHLDRHFQLIADRSGLHQTHLDADS